MNKVAILLGNNIDDGRDYLMEARIAIHEIIGKIDLVSSVYSSPPWGYQSKNYYKNQVVVCSTVMLPTDILSLILQIETSLGRIRDNTSATYLDRTIDIDILLYGNEIVQLDSLEIPHPRMHLRKFCLLPLSEIASEWVVPTFERTVLELLMETTDNSTVEKLS
jgi:2-amino-4-hydroxy-6-hydroxymethyldihydropteridine diphosphokinase